ncbi:MAG: metallophosphoesterase [bacterium]|nr:metallophosphoesterase [bacterium]
MTGPRNRSTAPGRHLFSFGIITDTHVNQGEDETNSPFESGRLANRRMRHVIRDLNARDLAFVVHVGDIVHPVPAIPGLYADAARRFFEVFDTLRHPAWLTPGNHDVGDKPNDWAPAARINEDHLSLWQHHFGDQYTSFDHQGCHFVIINAQVINSHLEAEERQRSWLEADLRSHHGRRIFLFSHYPPCLLEADEEETYDNIGEPGRSWLLELARQHQVEALIAGHVHNFWYLRLDATDCYILPSTAFVRFDYAEMLRASPGAETEFGRNDRPKLGYAICHVHEDGHMVEIVRTWGNTLDVGAAAATRPEHRLAAIHPRQNRRAAFGFDMRHNWMEIVEIPPTGGLDEFDRKTVRNDYPLLALWDMAVRPLRVPVRDLVNEANVARMNLLAEHGHLFTLMSFGAPTGELMERLKSHRDLFRTWDVAINPDVIDRDIGPIATAATSAGVPLVLSRLRSIDEQRAEAGKYYHSINQGFLVRDTEEIAAIARLPELDGVLAGVVFRLTLDMPVWETVAAASAVATGLGLRAHIHMRMAGTSPASPVMDDTLTVRRIAEAMAAAMTFADVTVFADTLVDIDRGYFPRSGVLDRLCNPRPGYHVVRHMHAAFDIVDDGIVPGTARDLAGGRHLEMREAGNPLVLVVPVDQSAALDVPWSGHPVLSINLLTGSVAPHPACHEVRIGSASPHLLMADPDGSRLRRLS